MKVKDTTVDIDNLSQPMLRGLFIIDEVHKLYTGEQVTVTSGAEWIPHSKPRSAHHRGDAIDHRIWAFDGKPYLMDIYLRELRENLGPEFVIVLESDHMHIHWSPRYHEIPAKTQEI